MRIILGLLVIVIVVAIYFAPAIIAFKKERGNRVAIFVLNLLLGWSFIGWVVSLIWALKEV